MSIISTEGLSPFQLEKLNELRQRLGDQLLADTPLFNDDISLLDEYYSSSVLGFDDNGNIIVVNCVGACQKSRAEARQKMGLRALVDLDGFNTDHLNNAALKIFMNLLKQLQSMFVDTTLQIYVINAHPIATAAFKLVFTVLPKQTRSKLMMLGSDYRGFLINELGAHNLYERWGGTKKPEKVILKTGYLRVGGVVPETKRNTIEMKIKEFENVEAIKFNVAARRCKEIDIPAVEKDGEQAWPQFRLSTNHVPEYGSILCRTAGEYKAKFDNTYSTFFSKDIQFKFVVKDN
uniref:CRAL-TRIO domain-containing protein n=1 Tax=Ditylenchus dipsaci TaxID=166011 RepID=A0A915CUV1_9BILA